MEVLARIRQLLAERNWSIYKLSKESGVSQSTLSNMFSRNNSPSISTLEEICKAFGITLAFLVSKVKTEIYSLPRLKSSINRLLKQLNSDVTIDEPTSFFHIEKWFKPIVISELDIIKHQIRKEPSVKIRRFLWVVFSDTIRIVSNARSCTYKLYIKTEKQIDSFNRSPIEVFRNCIENAYNRVEEFQNRLEKLGRIRKSGTRKTYIGSIDLRLGDSVTECTLNAIESCVFTIELLNEDALNIWDNGIGVSQDIERDVFNPFVTNKENGRGLGLFISKNNLENIGASIRLLRDRNEFGNLFKFHIDLSNLK